MRKKVVTAALVCFRQTTSVWCHRVCSKGEKADSGSVMQIILPIIYRNHLVNIKEKYLSKGKHPEYRSTTGVLEGIIESMNNIHCGKLFSIMHCLSQMLSAAGNRSSSSGQAESSHFYLWSRVLAIRNARKLLSLAVLSPLRKEKRNEVMNNVVHVRHTVFSAFLTR